MPTLRDLLNSHDPTQRLLAVDRLSRSSDVRSAKALQWIVLNDTDPDVHGAAVAALQARGIEPVLPHALRKDAVLDQLTLPSEDAELVPIEPAPKPDRFWAPAEPEDPFAGLLPSDASVKGDLHKATGRLSDEQAAVATYFMGTYVTGVGRSMTILYLPLLCCGAMLIMMALSVWRAGLELRFSGVITEGYIVEVRSQINNNPGRSGRSTTYYIDYAFVVNDQPYTGSWQILNHELGNFYPTMPVHVIYAPNNPTNNRFVYNLNAPVDFRQELSATLMALICNGMLVAMLASGWRWMGKGRWLQTRVSNS